MQWFYFRVSNTKKQMMYRYDEKEIRIVLMPLLRYIIPHAISNRRNGKIAMMLHLKYSPNTIL